ncbi:ABC-type transport auxiliary lipoprotein family protein [Pseudohoeflea coraliihabitans]|uniref:Membrane integrity-associated transporter subunit PqiC n=1 Tax=Pseudohoeflea coraliihabitans TaxID=2860393 RepID=A0ABS6WQ16_9HYPH|nr:ABC-type transport auxiliary lipoprotein family protein [Pseudohoeflea sp. DP4N28-3]MBW3098056.1 membrane integrity-associated transporter subunit PqiC [Pseudohoeflea sp. DP4N28-3]
MRAGFLLTIGLSALLAGCGSLAGLGKTPPDTYELSSAPVVKGRAAPRRQILVVEPLALKVLDSESIAIKPTPASVQYLADSQWADRLPKIVQAKLVQAYENSGRVGGVGRPGEGLAIDYQIATSIRAFEIRVDVAETAHVEISTKIINDRNGTVIAARIFEASSPVIGSGNVAYVAALDAAFEAVTEDLVSWSLSRFR